MYADEKLKAEIAKEALQKSGKVISAKRGAKAAILKKKCTIKLACTAVGISENCYRYSKVCDQENKQIEEWLIRIPSWKKRWGFGLCFDYLRNVKGKSWNHKRVYRIYCELEINQS